jgi:hypothetical protein
MGMDHLKLQLSKLQSAKKLRSQFVNRFPFKGAIRKRGPCVKNLHDRCPNSRQERYVTMRQRQRAPMWQNKCQIKFVNLLIKTNASQSLDTSLVRSHNVNAEMYHGKIAVIFLDVFQKRSLEMSIDRSVRHL